MNAVLKQKHASTRGRGYRRPANDVTVQTKPKVRVTESEILHWLLVEALKDEFSKQD